MRYTLFDIQRASLKPVAGLLAAGRDLSPTGISPIASKPLGRLPHALLDSAYRLIKEYPKQTWDYEDIVIGTRHCPVHMTVVQSKPFAKLLRFRREGLPSNAPRVLFVAAMSGHYATLSKDSLAEFLPDHDVYITDWANARDVPLSEGRFGFEEYVSYLIEFLEKLGGNAHLIGLCQAAVPALVAAAVMAEKADMNRPRSLTLMGGPIDIRVNPNQFYRRSRQLNLSWIRPLVIHTVPARYPGAGRKVYAGIQQLSGFISLDPKLHLRKHLQYFRDVLRGNQEAAQKHREFYDEYFSLMDATEEFYLETLQRVFIEQHLPDGCMQYQGETVNPSAISDIPILTVEGALDNMVAVGQTQAAHNICDQLPDADKHVLVQEGVGHYGIFSGAVYRASVAPSVKSFISCYRKPRD